MEIRYTKENYGKSSSECQPPLSAIVQHTQQTIVSISVKYIYVWLRLFPIQLTGKFGIKQFQDETELNIKFALRRYPTL